MQCICMYNPIDKNKEAHSKFKIVKCFSIIWGEGRRKEPPKNIQKTMSKRPLYNKSRSYPELTSVWQVETVWQPCKTEAGYDDPTWMVSPMFMGGISITASNSTAGRTETEIVGCMCVWFHVASLLLGFVRPFFSFWQGWNNPIIWMPYM